MAAKYPRRCCSVCGRKQVGWKLIPLRSAEGTMKVYLCFPCANNAAALFRAAHIQEAPDKKYMLWLAGQRAKDRVI
jgi:hypothetical protein